MSGSGHIDYSQGDLERKEGSAQAIVPPFYSPWTGSSVALKMKQPDPH